jgi:hypothetical protein
MLIGLGRSKQRSPTTLREVLKRAWNDYDEHGGTPHKEFWKDLATEDGVTAKPTANRKR